MRCGLLSEGMLMNGSIDEWFADHGENSMGDSIDDEIVEHEDPWD